MSQTSTLTRAVLLVLLLCATAVEGQAVTGVVITQHSRNYQQQQLLLQQRQQEHITAAQSPPALSKTQELLCWIHQVHRCWQRPLLLLLLLLLILQWLL